MRALAALLAFSFLPVSHGPHRPQRDSQLRRPIYVADMERLVPSDKVPFQPHETASPVLDDAGTRLYVGTGDGKVRVQFRGRTTLLYQAGGSVLAAPLVDGDVLYVGAADGFLVALDRFSGAVRWKSDIHEELTTQPVMAGGRVFVMSSEESVTAVDAKDGTRVWKFHRDPPGGFTIRGNATPRAAHGSVYVAFADGTVAALNPADGVARWTRQVTTSGDYSDVDDLAAPEDDTRIYAASAKGGIFALDAATGEQAWTTAMPGANHVLVDGARVIATARGAVVGLDRLTGKELWRMKLPADRYTNTPVAVDGLVLVAEERGKLLALDEASGDARGAFDPGSGFSQRAEVRPGVAYIISNGGVLFSLGLLP